MRWSCLLVLALIAARTDSSAQTTSEAGNLRLVITVDQQTINAPRPARVTLHLHNSGKVPLWLYRRALPSTSSAPGHSSEGPTLAIRIASADNSATSPGTGEVLDSVGLPHPKLIRLTAEDDYEEKTVIRWSPGIVEKNGEKRQVWGRYKFAVTYATKYSNAEELERILGVALWHGEVESNAVEIDLQPAPAANQGSIAGTVTGSEKVPRSGVLVSLSDQEERLLNQAATDFDGKFSFTHLPVSLYWVTVRRRDFTENTTVFRHLALTPSEPAGTIDFLLTPPETYEPKQMLHKPVLLRVTDGGGAPLGNVSLEITWSSGTVLDSVKGRTSDDGTAAVELIPGHNYVTLKRKGCPKDDERLDVSEGAGIDGFKLVSDCLKK